MSFVSPGLAATTIGGAVVPLLITEATSPSEEVYRWIIGGMATTIVSLAGFTWKLYERKTKADIELAIANTKLEAYGSSAPDLADEIKRLGERLAEQQRQHQRFLESSDLPWPMQQSPSRPTMNRRTRP